MQRHEKQKEWHKQGMGNAAEYDTPTKSGWVGIKSRSDLVLVVKHEIEEANVQAPLSGGTP